MIPESAGGPPVSLKDRALAIFLGVGGVVLATFVGYLIVRLWPIAILILVSLMLVAALAPVVRKIQRKYNRKTATTLVVVMLLAVIVGILAITVPPVVAQFTRLASDLERILTEVQTNLSEHSPSLAKALAHIRVVALPDTDAPQTTRDFVFTAFTLVAGFVTVLMLTVYLVVDGPAVATTLVSFFPRERRLQIRQMFGEIADQVGAYIRGQLLTSFLAGMVAFVVLSAFGVPNALALSWLVALLDAIPIVGPIAAMVPIAVTAYGVSAETAAWVLGILIVYSQIESYIIVPRLFGKALNLSPLTVLLSILVGATLLGIVGAFIALPFAAMVPILLRYFREWRDEGIEGPESPPAHAR
jgi:predicted PurR-regulated permease PerM